MLILWLHCGTWFVTIAGMKAGLTLLHSCATTGIPTIEWYLRHRNSLFLTRHQHKSLFCHLILNYNQLYRGVPNVLARRSIYLLRTGSLQKSDAYPRRRSLNNHAIRIPPQETPRPDARRPASPALFHPHRGRLRGLSQALSALLFLYREVLHREVDELSITRARRCATATI